MAAHLDDHSAHWTDPSTGIRETAEFLDGICIYLTSPATSPKAGVIICSPLNAEYVKNYRREVLLARRLAALGFEVARFDYRASGNSPGDPAQMVFPALVGDGLEAGRILSLRSEAPVLGLVGTRLGALVAAALRRSYPAASLVLVDPVMEYDQYLSQLDRARALQIRAEGLKTEETIKVAPIGEDLARDGVTDVLGFAFYEDLHRTMRGRSLIGELNGGRGKILVIQLSLLESPSVPLARAVERLQATGNDVQLTVVAGEEENWWFRQGVRGFQTEESRALTTEVVEKASIWLADTIGAGIT